LVNNTSAGYVFINVIDEPPIGRHASIQIKVNVAWQGRGIGRLAYLLASKASRHNTIYAHMRKSNIASRKAAEHAGYTVADEVRVPQLLMVWNRPYSHIETSRSTDGKTNS
jgi:RimJ/RimL family protein N-acetyltransferase